MSLFSLNLSFVRTVSHISLFRSKLFSCRDLNSLSETHKIGGQWPAICETKSERKGHPEADIMFPDTLDCRPFSEPACAIDADRLAQFIAERFPEEAARIDLSNRGDVVDLAIELLERLWRWEH
jgi:hypothetical protein